MAIVRLDPFSEADSFRYRLDKLFNSLDATRVSSWTRQQDWIPTIEVRETDDLVRVQIALPGLEAKDLDIHVSQAAVLVSGERTQIEPMESEHLISSEFLYGRFRRVIPLDVKVKNTEAKADMANGLLTLTLPKADEERNRVFQVKLSEPQVAQSVKIS
ncbi:MAG: Hsp20/alpha crystallin family protein [Symploca sp. SIO2G7]|nr:Hsp20/alpha crystallin family protein [Symploca sp. SIO2G7]